MRGSRCSSHRSAGNPKIARRSSPTCSSSSGPREVGQKAIHVALLLAVEVLSPSTRRKDRVLKFSKYEEAGVESYGIVDGQRPSVTAYGLRDGRYAEIGTATGAQTLELRRPFPVRITPSELP